MARITRVIDRGEFNSALNLYWRLINQMPVELQEVFPHFENFINPTDDRGNYHTHNDVELSIIGIHRFEMLRSPHANTLLRAWAIKRKGERKRNYEG